ncbi:MAG: DUF3047 domain-containing protein [Nitrospirota bacterium]|nr:DUF3047 domain-containing protein [Nitrospirota bacterium]MDH5586843.1 DUF3047 domain-containing protein [Nitrospirota bacterium]MDH5774888.1 DUF3047 domain-containing protein [Nitrospirota bacterium]
MTVDWSGSRYRLGRIICSWGLSLLGVVVVGMADFGVAWAADSASPASSTNSILIEDFQNPDERGFPQGWGAQRSVVTAHETYMIQKEEDVSFLRATKASQRVFTKQMTWDPKTHPILVWRWRIQAVPEGEEFIAAIYPSLDTDLMFIPVNTKYVWSGTLPAGSIKEGGMFSSTEIVIRSGTEPLGQWVEERVNVYQDFLKIHNHEPAPLAWGISVLGGSAVEIDFGSIRVEAE